jgi:hypothetical protein
MMTLLEAERDINRRICPGHQPLQPIVTERQSIARPQGDGVRLHGLETRPSIENLRIAATDSND